MLSKKYRLSSKRIKNVYQNGKKYRGNYGMLIATPSDTDNPQFLFVVSKKIGNAPTRHRMTRLLRQISMDVIKDNELLNKGFQFQYIAFKFTDSYKELRKEYEKQLLEATK